MALNIQSVVHSVKMQQYSPNCTVPLKVPAASLAETGKLVLQFLCNVRDSSSTFSGKEQSCRTHMPPFQNVQQSYTSQDGVFLAEGQMWRQGSRTEGPEILRYGQFSTRTPRPSMGKERVFQQRVPGKLHIHTQTNVPGALPPTLKRVTQVARGPERKHSDSQKLL